MNHENWKKKPGGYDSLNWEKGKYPSSNPLGIPNLRPQPTDLVVPGDIYPYSYRQKIRTERPTLIHTHVCDYRFHVTWSGPAMGLRSVQRPGIWAACTPDFSLWMEFPKALQIYNTYRNRWVGRYWQEAGVLVIPTINWSDEESYEYAFLGVPKRQIVTIRTHSSAKPDEVAGFIHGYKAMCEAIEPRHVLWFGPVYPECEPLTNIIPFDVGHWTLYKKSLEEVFRGE